MQNLRIISATVIDSSNLEVKFTDVLVPNLVTSNVLIIADSPNTPDSEVLGIKIAGDKMEIVCQPLTPFASYFVQFRSVPQHPFISLHATARLSEDGVSNRTLITGPLEPNNPVKNFLDSFLRDNIYRNDDDNTVISQYIKSLSVNLARALYDVRQVKNENYLSFTVVDEQKVRGEGPFDRLNEESAYEVLRVGRGLTSANTNTTFAFPDFPSFPITLQKQDNLETLQPDSVDEVGKFNINSLILNLNAKPVTKVTSIVFTFISATPIYTYNISEMGYQIKNSRYDQDFGFTYLLLEDNQIKISDKVLEDPNFDLDSIFKVDVTYESKDLGRVINPDSVTVYTVVDVIREVLPPIINVFNLKHAPVVLANNSIPTLGAITFTDPNTTNPSAKHPAFITEIPFRLNGLPFIPGQYAIDYSTGTVYVYGADANNDGTGAFPPLATYKYRFVYQSDQDYTLDTDTADIVALPRGNLVHFDGNINFDYEEVFVPGTDYIAGLHQESLNERINNQLVALNVLKTANSPITNVFRIFNETSGEIYTLDRWNDNKVHFRYNNPPRIEQQLGERVFFRDITNELLFVNATATNAAALRVFKILLTKNRLVASTEDSVASSFNTSLVFSKTDIFAEEKWYNRDFSEVVNFDRLLNVGEYTVDYANGVVYCAVSNTQDFDLGTASYKDSFIALQHPHIISVDDIYYRISILNPKNKQFTYTSFEDGLVEPEELDPSDELFLNNTSSAPYQLFNSSVGVFVASSFVSGVTNQINFVRSVYEYDDLLNSTHPFNFVEVSSASGFSITVNSVEKQFFDNVQVDDDGYYVYVNENIPYLSPNITYEFTVIRASDSLPLWDSTNGTIVPGNPLKLILTENLPNAGDLVTVTYTITINNLSRVVIDYNKGDYFIDYTYLADEILVSYEYGDNILDFRRNANLAPGSAYYVTYKVGALRDSLLRNFGTLINVKGLADVDLDFARERYRDALTAGLTSFIQGPTLNAIKNIGKTISHIEPEVIESIFEGWSLGNSLLSPQSIDTTGSFQLLPAKFDNGVLIDQPDQTVTFPVNSNIRLEEGTFETWISPQWNGLDNEANLTFSISLDGYVIDPSKVFIGAGEDHPTISDGVFSLNKNTNVIGTPNRNKDGVFIYYDLDTSGSFYRWYVEVIDGYVESTTPTYRFKISSDGTFYDVKSLTLPKPSNMTVFTGVHSVNLTITAGSSGIDEGLTFISDVENYILDFGTEINRNRLSIFKDVSGYLNFRVYDKDKRVYTISADVSSWVGNELHHIAASWKLNTRNNRDEMHLFVDGFEVPNIIKYGQKLRPYLHEKYRTVDPEEVLGLLDRDILSSIDLHTVAGVNTVTSSINFDTYQIFAGDTIFIDEVGFDSNGYTIVTISGQTLTLNTVMPLTLNDARFSINRTAFEVISDIDIVPNITVSTMHPVLDGYDLSGNTGFDTVTSAVDFTAAGILPGYLISIDDPALSITYMILQVSTNTLTIDDDLPATFSSTTFRIYDNSETELPGVRALRPDYSISNDGYFNNILTVSNGAFAGDLLLIRTLGLNNRRIRKDYYIWGDHVENVLMTRLPPPISLDEVSITKIIFPNTAIGPSNSTLSLGFFNSINFPTSQPTNDIDGRTLTATISGTNTDFTTPVEVTIDGNLGITPVTETLFFSDYGSQDFASGFTSVNFVNVVVDPLNPLKSALNLVVKEKFPITHGEFDGYYPVIKYSYHAGSGYYLQNDGVDAVRDEENIFSSANVGNYLRIYSPGPVAGFYLVTGLSEDRKSLSVTPIGLTPPLSSFTGGVYQLFNTTSYRSGLQNGFFNFEINQQPNNPYFLNQGFYEIDYASYAIIKFDPTNDVAYIGSDLNGNHQANALLDQVKIYSVMLTDTRIGEVIPSNQRSITKDFNSLKPLVADANTLMLIDFDTFPFTNEADFYINPSTVKNHFQSSIVVNENFGNSLVFLDQPLLVPNDGILDTRKEASIEFWVNPLFDTGNDPNLRFYFDAFGAVVEEAVSVNSTSVKISAPASQILSVKLKGGDPAIDYFAGGKLEIDTQRAVQEEAVSLSNSSVVVSQPILQVITVKIVGDLTGTDYFADGNISTDKKTIYLGKLLPSDNVLVVITYQTTNNNNETFNTQVIRLHKKLPYQKSHVIVNYLPKGLQGDRVSIFKDEFGFTNFMIVASEVRYVVRAQTRWAKNTWHRVKATYKVNGGTGTDEMRLFVDGYEFSDILYGSGAIFNTIPSTLGASMPGDGYVIMDNIRFKDPINDLFIGSQYTKESPIFSLIDNFRISNISRPLYAPYGEPLDVSYSSNLDMVFPVTEDLYTTYLLDFDSLSSRNEDFTIIRNRESGLFDFSVNIFDSFGIVNSNIKSQEALENLIKVLKPANSRVFIQYIR